MKEPDHERVWVVCSILSEGMNDSRKVEGKRKAMQVEGMGPELDSAF